MAFSTVILNLFLLSVCVVSGKEETDLYSFKVTDIENNEVDLETFRGKVSLILNVASKCGYTNSHYKELQKMYADFGSEYFTVLAFPCNQFGGQEPEEESVIHQFVKDQYGVKFPMLSKVDVKGENAHPLWKSLVKESGVEPNWNFFKYIVDHTGKLVAVLPTKASLWQYDIDKSYDRIKKLVKEAKRYAKENPTATKNDNKEEL